jgi:hypothetical protein
VLARGWAIAEGEDLLYEHLTYNSRAEAVAGFMGSSLGAWYELFEDAEKDNYRAVYVEIVESPPPEGGKEESRG